MQLNIQNQHGVTVMLLTIYRNTLRGNFAISIPEVAQIDSASEIIP